MSTKLNARNNGKTSEEGINRPVSQIISRDGVVNDSDLLVAAAGTPDNTVRIPVGDVFIGTDSPSTTEPSYYYHGWVTAEETVTITANASGNPRIDAIVAYVDLSVQDSTLSDNPGALKFAAIPGTTAASPVIPTDATTQASVGASNPWVLLAEVAVANGFSSITNANITGYRPKADTPQRRFDDSLPDFVATGLVPAQTSGLIGATSPGYAYIDGRLVYKAKVIKTYTASKDTYVDLPKTAKPTTNDDYTYTAVANGAAAPALATSSVRIAKVITSGAAITSVVSTGLDSLGNRIRPLSTDIGANSLRFGTTGSILDNNGNELVKFVQTASAVNEVTLTNAATGTSPDISATGDDANIGLTITPKGTGNVGFTKRADGWVTGQATPNTVTALGNRSYSMVYNSTDLTDHLSAGMRLRTSRTAAAPAQSTSLNGTTQYYNKASPSGMTFTDDFTVSAWIKLSSITGGNQAIAGRYNGTSGWFFFIDSGGKVQLAGFNAAAGNFSSVGSYETVPLNKWVHVTAQLDMSAFTATTTTSYTMIDGLDVPASVARGGTNPTALIQPAADMQIGAANSTAFFTGKIAQVAIYSAKVTQATILASMHQTLAGTETSLVSAYSFNNTINDLNANANNLSANASAVATNADSPYGGQADGTISSTLDYAIITKTAFSTNTTLTVQVPEGCTIPTTGGVSAVSYSTQKVPYLFPTQRGKWQLEYQVRVSDVGAVSAGVFLACTSVQFNIPIGDWAVSWKGVIDNTKAAAAVGPAHAGITSSSSSFSDSRLTAGHYHGSNVSSIQQLTTMGVPPIGISLSAATIYYFGKKSDSADSSMGIRGDVEPLLIIAECASL